MRQDSVSDDITGTRDELASTVAELSRSQRMLRSVIDNLPAMIGYWNRDLRNVLGNKAYVEWFGKTPEQMLGLHIREVIGEELYEKNLPYMLEALAGRQQHFDRTIVDASGRTRYSQASYIPDVDEDGTVQGFFVLVADVTERVIAEMELAAAKAELEKRATTDALTGMANRAHFEESAEQALERMRARSATPVVRAADDVEAMGTGQHARRDVGLVLLDLDGFKPVNDTLGHAAGDELLGLVATRLRTAVREPDVVARLGGDEFVVLLPEMNDLDHVFSLAERLVRVLRAPFTLSQSPDAPVTISASVGCAVARRHDRDVSLSSLLRAADRMMYAAKQQGGNRWVAATGVDAGA